MPENYLPTLLNGLQEAVFILDKNRIVLSDNPVAEQIFGKGHVGQDFVKVSRHPDCIGAIGQVLSQAQQFWQVTFVDSVVKANLQVNVTSLGLNNADGARVLVCVQDVSEMHKAEQMRSDFVANVSHELRSPLTALSGFIETIGLLEDSDNVDRNRFLDLMDMEAQRMIRLIADLLSLSKVESRQRQRSDGNANIVSIIERVQNTLVDLAAREEKTFELSIADNIPEIPGNEDELTQVFQNLIENAVKYGRRNTHVWISVAKKDKVLGVSGEALVIEVQDEGDGIAQHHIPRLTERFYRVDTHRSRNMGGTGLGLAIVKHIINRYRGRFSVTSQEGVGSRFTVALPMTYPTSR